MMGEACGTRGREEKGIRDLVRKTGGKRGFGRIRRRWENTSNTTK
jgi:hypothetical protein